METVTPKAICHACKKELIYEVGQKIGRQDECHHCGAPLRCCKMCRFYDVTHYNECREPLAERVVEKEKFNFCNYFELSTSHDVEADKKRALDQASALFKN